MKLIRKYITVACKTLNANFTTNLNLKYFDNISYAQTYCDIVAYVTVNLYSACLSQHACVKVMSLINVKSNRHRLWLKKKNYVLMLFKVMIGS